MSREHKFRAWDEANKRWWYFSLKDLTESHLHDLAALKYWEEWTTQTDKNGQDIYDGDYIEYDKGFGKDRQKKLIVWYQNRWAGAVPCKCCQSFDCKKGGARAPYPINKRDWKRCEVTGTKHNQEAEGKKP